MKKNIILKAFLFFYLMIFYNHVIGQNQLFKYDLEYKPSPLQNNTIIEKMVLEVENTKSSIFRTEHEKKSDSLIAKTGLGLGRKPTFENQFYIIKKLADNEVKKSIQTMYSEIFSVKINEKLNWEIFPEKSKIGTFEVQKATVNYGGRNWIAWFASEIPIQDGPYIFHGLPGLIIKISDNENNYIFSLTEIKASEGDITYRTKSSELTWEQFEKLSENYYSDPFATLKSMGIPIKVDDGNGNGVTPDLKILSDQMKKKIKENNNPIELNHKIDYR